MNREKPFSTADALRLWEEEKKKNPDYFPSLARKRKQEFDEAWGIDPDSETNYDRPQ